MNTFEYLGNPAILSGKGLKDFKILKRAFLLRQQWIGCELCLLHIKHDPFVPCSSVKRWQCFQEDQEGTFCF